jgi:hypothetical protein
MREVDGADTREKVLSLYRDHRKNLQSGRLGFPRQVPPLSGHNLWDSNMPGSTLFMPVCDVSFSFIGLTAQFVDPKLQRFAAKNGRGTYVVDDPHGMRPAGTEPWLKLGFLDEGNVLPLSHLERQACYFMFSEPAVICQNMFLATEAIGIGGWMHCGFTSREVFAALGFTSVAPGDTPALANPVGLDGIFQAYCPPYFPNMDAAVDAALASYSRAGPPAQLTARAPMDRPTRRTCVTHVLGTFVTYVSGSDPKFLERAKGFEPSTPTLARLCSTPELHPHPKAPAALPPALKLCQKG